MKRLSIILSILSIILVVVFFAYSISHQPKIGYVESDKLLANYKGMIAASEAYKSKFDIWKTNLDTLRSELEKEISKYQKEKSALSKKEDELSQKLIDTKRQQLIKYQRDIERKAGAEDKSATEAVLKKVNEYISNYGKENGYDFIIAATQSGNLVYAKGSLNLTDEILKGLNEEYESR